MVTFSSSTVATGGTETYTGSVSPSDTSVGLSLYTLPGCKGNPVAGGGGLFLVTGGSFTQTELITARPGTYYVDVRGGPTDDEGCSAGPLTVTSAAPAATPIPGATLPAASTPAAATPAPVGDAATVTPGLYECFAFSGGELEGRPDLNFTISDSATYMDVAGTPGTYTFDPGSQVLTFQGAADDGQRAFFDGTRIPNTIAFLNANNNLGDTCQLGA